MVMPFPGVSPSMLNAPAETLPKLFGKGNLIRLPTAAGWTEDKDAGSTAQAVNYLGLSTAAAGNDTSILYAQLLGMVTSASPMHNFNWDKKLIFSFAIVRDPTQAGAVTRVQIKKAVTEGILADDGLGIQVTNFTVIGECFGAAQGTTATIKTLTAGKKNQITIIHYPGVKVEWYVDGVLAATYSTVANVPNGVVNASYYVVFSLDNNATATACSAYILNPWIWQEL